MKNKKIKIILSILLIFTFLLTTGFTTKRLTPKTVYRIYLRGESLGQITSKKELEDYIDKKQEEIKKKYGVDKVYVPSDLDIVKEITYTNKITSVEKIYQKIKDISPFTINGYAITISGLDSQDEEGKTVEGKKQTIYVLNKETFSEAVDSVVKSFVNEDDYNAFASKNQKKIEDTGKIIEKIYIENSITINQQRIPVNKTIYQDPDILSQYLLFGSKGVNQTYTVTAGDTISNIAFNHKISTEELLISNPSIVDESSLLYTGQTLKLGVLDPQFNVVEQDHVVFREEKKFQTEVRYDDNQYVGYEKTIQTGVNGENRVTQKVLTVNGIRSSLVTVSTETLKESINEIIVKGTRRSAHMNPYGTVVPTTGEWGWPASCSSISSNFGYRWGVLHDGTDIAGCGYGSNIFAAQSGTVVESKKKTGYYAGGYGDNGEYIIIDHHNGIYTIYAHMCPGCRYVSVGDQVEKGQVIGGMGQTGAATGVHLHYGMWIGYPYYGGRAVNAMNYY